MQTGGPGVNSYGMNSINSYTRFPDGKTLDEAVSKKQPAGPLPTDEVAKGPTVEPQPQVVAQVNELAQEELRSEVKKKDRKEKAVQIEKHEDISEQEVIQEPDAGIVTEDEKEMIKNMKKTITLTSGKVARKVNKSAFKYMVEKKNWIKGDARSEAEEFFTIRIPKVMAKELSKILNEVLGLDIPSEDTDSRSEVA